MSQVNNFSIFQQNKIEEKKMSKKYHVRERLFLNQKLDMRAYVIAVVEDTRETPSCCETHRKGGEIRLDIADCFEEISLHFTMDTVEERENSLHKIRKLVEVLAAVQQALEIEAETINERQTVQQHARAVSAVH